MLRSVEPRTTPFHFGAVLGVLLMAPIACSAVVDLDDLSDGMCEPGLKLCDGECVVPTVDNGCNGGSCAACNFDRATPYCDANGCALNVCVRDWGDCNEIQSDGCETNLLTDPLNCGACANDMPSARCEYANAVAACRNGVCRLNYCDPTKTFLDCNLDDSDGCEFDAALGLGCGDGCPCAEGTECVDGECIE